MPIPRDKRKIIQGWPKYIATFGPEMNWEQALRVEDFTDVSRPPLTSRGSGRTGHDSHHVAIIGEFVLLDRRKETAVSDRKQQGRVVRLPHV